MRRLRLDDRILRVRDEGEGGKPPLVFIHGAGGSSVVWMDAVRRLSPQRRVVALDLPAHGQSDPWHAISIALYRDAVGTVCATLKIERAVLIGHSVGALIALACAAAWPERVAGLVTVGGAARIDVAPRLLDLWARDPVDAAARMTRVGWSPATPREIVERWAGLAMTAAPEVTLADLGAVAAFDGRELCARVRAPTLVVHGGDDLLVPPSRGRELAQAVPGAEYTLLPRAGHHPMLEQPDEFFAELDRFLRQI